MNPSAIQDLGERWELGDEIGSGAIARVVRVRDRVTGNVYAAKLLHPRHQRDEGARTRFQREAELSARLVADNLVRVWGTDIIAGHVAMVMELVEGPTLARYLARQGTLPEHEIIELAVGIASGLAHAHAGGVIHRDLKPANVLLARGDSGWVPKIADFGMARASSFAEADRGALTVLGTPPYMAPECLDPLAVDPRTDFYALGCMMFELANGAPPYSGATPFALLEAHRTAPIPSLHPRVSPGFDRLVRRLLAKSPGDRPQSSATIANILIELRAPQSVALATLGAEAPSPDLVGAGRCAGCGGDILEDVRVCFRCGAAPVIIESGEYRVLVSGPGRISDKLDSTRRDRLVEWLQANAGVGFDPSKLRREIPRFPFVLVRDVSLASANSIVDSIARLGLQADATKLGISHPQMLTHVRRMTSRRASLVAAIVLAPSLTYMPLMVVLFPLVIVAVAITAGVTAASASRTTVASTPTTRAALPAALDQRVRALQFTVPQIRERRHREALGAVVGRVLALVRRAPPQVRDETAAEMAHAVNVAMVASARMDEIESWMTQKDFDPSNPEHRAFMHERDTWAARLLGLTATLDALVARLISAEARTGLVVADELLRDIRATVEALEEVQRT